MPEITWPSDNQPSERWPLYTRGNVGEVYPDVVLPLEWSIAGHGSEQGWRRGALEMGFLTPNDLDGGGPNNSVPEGQEFTLIGVFGGYAYFNAGLMRLLGVRTPGLTADAIDKQFLGEADVAAYIPRPGDRNARATLKVIATALRTLRAKSVPRVEELTRIADRFIASAPSLDASDEALLECATVQVGSIWPDLIAGHVINTLQATISAGVLTDFCEKHLGDPNLALSFTTGIGEVVSARPAKAMWKLANETATDAFDDAFADFLAEFGHRGPNEFSMGGRDWAAYPEVALAAIDAMRGADPDRSPMEQDRKIELANNEVLAKAHKTLGRRAKKLDKAIANTALWSRAREESKDQVIRVTQVSRHRYLEMHRRAAARGGVADPIGPLMLTAEEFEKYLKDPEPLVGTIEQRLADRETLSGLAPPFAFDASHHNGSFPPINQWPARPKRGTQVVASGTNLAGAAGAPGVARGPARIVTDPGDPGAIEPGDILVAPLTDPAWTPLFLAASGVVVEVGAAMSHSMIVSRELGIPCVVGVADATLKITDGTIIEIDGQAGTVRVV